jgi:small subunit ribosomal protein S16
MYQIVAMDSRVARNGKFLEIIGRYEPVQHPMVITTKDDRVVHWLKNGALPTDTVRSLLQRNGLWFKWSMMKRGMDQAAIATEMEKWQMAQAGKRQVEEARKARRKAARKRKKSGEAAVPAAEPAPAAAPVQA